MVQPVSNSASSAAQAVSAATRDQQQQTSGASREASRQRAEQQRQADSAERRRERSRASNQQSEKELPNSMKQRLSLGIIPETDDMFIKVVDTQKGQTVDVRPSVSLLKSNLVINEVVGKFVDRNA